MKIENALEILGQASVGNVTINDEFKEACRVGSDAIQALPIAEKQGMEKVVDFIRSNVVCKTYDGGLFIYGHIAGEKWQAFLKDNGLDQPKEGVR